MRIVCETIEDFLENLESLGIEDGADQLFHNEIRRSVSHRDKQETSRKVILQFTAVVCRHDGSEFLLDFGIDCGFDEFSPIEDLAGTVKEQQITNLVKGLDLVKSGIWTIKPGTIHV